MARALHPTRSSRHQQQTGRRWAHLAGWMLILIVIAGCALPAPFAGASIETETIATDNDLLKASYVTPGSDRRAALTREEALNRAAAMISRADQAKAVRARQALLSLESETGQVVTQERHAWLITYDGVGFESTLGCSSCYRQQWQHTTVALDAQTGQVFLVFGTGRA